MSTVRQLLPPLGVGLALAVGLGTLRRLRRFELAGRACLVTGGSRGLGLEIARVLVDRGARVALVARDREELDRAVRVLRGLGKGEVIGVSCDLSDGPAIDAMLAAVRAELGPIEVLVNCAGGIQVGPLDAMTVVLGAPAKAAALANVLFPNAVTGLLSVVTGLLPKGTDPRPKAGKDSESPAAPSVFTAATDSAARRNNEL